jgi:hypothetical protein
MVPVDKKQEEERMAATPEVVPGPGVLRESACIRQRRGPASCCSSPVNPGSTLRPPSRSAPPSSSRHAKRFATLMPYSARAPALRRSWSNTTVLVANADDFAELTEPYREFFATDPPARMTMQVPLPRGLLLSIGCVAFVES